MKKRLIVVAGILMFLLGATAPGFSAEQQAVPADKISKEQKPAAPAEGMTILITDPLTNATVTVQLASMEGADRPLAVVGNEKITVEDFRYAVADSHQKKDDVEQAPKIDFAELLNRLITVRLMVQEAGTIGLEDLPAIKDGIDTFSKVTLRNLLREELWKDLTANEEKVEKLYRADVDEMKITLVVFAKKQDATKARGAIKRGKNFNDVVDKAVKDGTAIAKEEGHFFKINELDSAIAKQMPKMKTGAISRVSEIKKGGKTVFGFFRLDEKRIVDSPEAKEAARKKVLEEGMKEVVSKYVRSLYKTGVKIDEKLRDSLDYGPNGPGIEKLLEDKRAVVDIKGEEPITVGQLSESLQDKLYHGMKNVSKPKLDKMEKTAIEVLVEKRLLLREALKRGIDKTAAYKRMLSEYKRDALFGAFVEKVVVPDIRLTEAELKAYYKEHANEYLSSEMVKIRTLAFKEKADAAVAIDQLRKGADFSWVKANAEGQLEKDAERSLPFEEEQYVASQALPEDMQKAIEGIHAGDFRLYEAPVGILYVLDIQEVIPPTTQPFEEVRGHIREVVFGRKLNRSLEEWAAKLRESYEVKIYLSGIENK